MEIYGKTIGILGFGRIGMRVGTRARAFGMKVLAYDPYLSEQSPAVTESGAELLPLEEVLAQADILSLHVFLNAQTRGLINAERLGLMKRGAYLVNTSRGPVVDEKALIAALQNGLLAGAGLDVMEVEPIPADSPLLKMPNVLLTPHMASYSEEGDLAHHHRTAEIIQQVVRGGLPERKVVVNKDLYDQVAAGHGAASVS
jgi:D-3-phosphoglycerate dehydrogenase